MPDLDFQIDGVEPMPYAAAPMLAFKLLVRQVEPLATIQSVALRCQIRIEPARRRYSSNEQEKLIEIFAEPSRWGQTVKSMLWENVGINIPGFANETRVDLPVPCSFDFNIATTKYFDALEDGLAPLTFLFSGTIFHAAEDGSLQISQISWETEATFRMPVSAWRRLMDIYYPNTAWLPLRKDLFDRLHELKRNRAASGVEQVIESLLEEAADRVIS